MDITGHPALKRSKTHQKFIQKCTFNMQTFKYVFAEIVWLYPFKTRGSPKKKQMHV